MEECHKLLTDQVDDAILRYNVSKPLPLGGKPGHIWEGIFPDVGLEQLVPDQIWIKEECKYDIAAMYGYLNHLSPEDKKILTTAVNLWTRNLVIRHRVEDFQLGIESYQTQLNLTKTSMMEARDWSSSMSTQSLDSPWAVTFQRHIRLAVGGVGGVQMIMRFNEIHKFSDGTLQQIDEALDYRVKEFQINRTNPGMDTRFWSKKDVGRSKDFTFAIQKRLKTRRIFRNLESFVGRRIRECDYRLLKRTE
ncbi:hypothetical protein Tco_1391818 [Tanacetum coccineum]